MANLIITIFLTAVIIIVGIITMAIEFPINSKIGNPNSTFFHLKINSKKINK